MMKYLAILLPMAAMCANPRLGEDHSVKTPESGLSTQLTYLPAKGKPFWGAGYGPYRRGQKPGTAVDASAVKDDLVRLSKLCSVVRTYGLGDGQDEVARAADSVGLTVWQGVWLGKSTEENAAELKALPKVAALHAVVGVCVGNEVLQRGDLPVDRLAELLAQARKDVAKKPLAYADTPGELIENAKQLAPLVDVVFVNVHPFWDQVEETSAVAHLWSRVEDVAKAYPGKRVVVSETGWPTSGGTAGQATAGIEAQGAFVRDLLKSLPAHPETGVMYFEAFDEAWKTENGFGSSWGLLDDCGKTKAGLVGVVPKFDRDPGRCPMVETKEILTDGRLGPGLSMGVDTSGRMHDWVRHEGDHLTCAYPGDQDWGAVFMAEGSIEAKQERRKWFDLSGYKELVVELKAVNRAVKASIGIKSTTDQDDGSEPKVFLNDIATTWQTLHIDLARFAVGGVLPDNRLTKAYVLFELVFEPDTPKETIYLRNVRFIPKE